MSDAATPEGLERFVAAQDADGTYERAVAELRSGRKQSHWMWFVFPQIAGLGESAMSRHFALASLAEAGEYLRHPVLGPRLRECAAIVAAAPPGVVRAEQLLGGIDAVKLRSSMTLFALADPGERAFAAVLERFYDGVGDPATLARC